MAAGASTRSSRCARHPGPRTERLVGSCAFSAWMNANFTCSPSRRRPPLFLGSPARSAAPCSRGGAAASSSRSAVVSSPGLPWPRSTFAWCTQSRSADSVRSSSRATSGMLLPPSSTSRTVSALNSRVNARRFRFAMRTPIYAFPRVSTKSGQFHLVPSGTVRWVQFKMETVAHFYQRFCTTSIIGKPVDAFVIKTGVLFPPRPRR